jgi:hypothetical protein
MKKRIVKPVRARTSIRRIKPAKPAPTAITAQGRVSPPQLRANSALLVIEEHTIRAMLVDPRYLQAVPCLQAGKQRLAKAGTGCGGCSRTRAASKQKALASVKQCIANLTAPQREQVKRLLGAKQVRVVLQGKHVTF